MDTLILPFVILISGNKSLMWKVLSLNLEVSGQTTLYPEVRNSGHEAYTHKNYYFFNLLLQSKTLSRFFVSLSKVQRLPALAISLGFISLAPIHKKLIFLLLTSFIIRSVLAKNLEG